MSLMSPGSSLGSEQSSSRPSSTTSLNDGFFPVFDQMEEPLPSAAVSSLISAPFPSPMTNRISEKVNLCQDGLWSFLECICRMMSLAPLPYAPGVAGKLSPGTLEGKSQLLEREEGL